MCEKKRGKRVKDFWTCFLSQIMRGGHKLIIFNARFDVRM